MPHPKYAKPQKFPYVLQPHNEVRMKLAELQPGPGTSYWRTVVFRHEKKNSSLTGLQGLSCNWHDLREDAEMISTSQQDGSKFRVWGVVCYNGTIDFFGVHISLNRPSYCNEFQQGLVVQANAKLDDAWTLMQDTSSEHTFNHMTS